MKKAPGLLLAIGMGKKKSMMDDGPDDDDEELSEFDGFADDAYRAIKAGDKEAFRMALKGAVQCCHDDDEDDDEEN